MDRIHLASRQCDNTCDDDSCSIIYFCRCCKSILDCVLHSAHLDKRITVSNERNACFCGGGFYLSKYEAGLTLDELPPKMPHFEAQFFSIWRIADISDMTASHIRACITQAASCGRGCPAGFISILLTVISRVTLIYLLKRHIKTPTMAISKILQTKRGAEIVLPTSGQCSITRLQAMGTAPWFPAYSTRSELIKCFWQNGRVLTSQGDHLWRMHEVKS